MTPNAGRITTSSGVSASIDSPGSRQEPDALRAQLIVDVRVVDDLAGQDDRRDRETLARLVGVIDRAIDAVAEAELAREMDRQPAGRVAGSRCP